MAFGFLRKLTSPSRGGAKKSYDDEYRGYSKFQDGGKKSKLRTASAVATTANKKTSKSVKGDFADFSVMKQLAYDIDSIVVEDKESSSLSSPPMTVEISLTPQRKSSQQRMPTKQEVDHPLHAAVSSTPMMYDSVHKDATRPFDEITEGDYSASTITFGTTSDGTISTSKSGSSNNIDLRHHFSRSNDHDLHHRLEAVEEQLHHQRREGEEEVSNDEEESTVDVNEEAELRDMIFNEFDASNNETKVAEEASSVHSNSNNTSSSSSESSSSSATTSLAGSSSSSYTGSTSSVEDRQSIKETSTNDSDYTTPTKESEEVKITNYVADSTMMTAETTVTTSSEELQQGSGTTLSVNGAPEVVHATSSSSDEQSYEDSETTPKFKNHDSSEKEEQENITNEEASASGTRTTPSLSSRSRKLRQHRKRYFANGGNLNYKKSPLKERPVNISVMESTKDQSPVMKISVAATDDDDNRSNNSKDNEESSVVTEENSNKKEDDDTPPSPSGVSSKRQYHQLYVRSGGKFPIVRKTMSPVGSVGPSSPDHVLQHPTFEMETHETPHGANGGGDVQVPAAAASSTSMYQFEFGDDGTNNGIASQDGTLQRQNSKTSDTTTTSASICSATKKPKEIRWVDDDCDDMSQPVQVHINYIDFFEAEEYLDDDDDTTLDGEGIGSRDEEDEPVDGEEDVSDGEEGEESEVDDDATPVNSQFSALDPPTPPRPSTSLIKLTDQIQVTKQERKQPMLPEHMDKPVISILKKPSPRFMMFDPRTPAGQNHAIGVMNRSSGSDLSPILHVDSGMSYDDEYGSNVSSDVFDFDPEPRHAHGVVMKRVHSSGQEESKDESYFEGDGDGDSYTASSWISGGVTSASGTTTGYMGDMIVEEDDDDDDTFATYDYQKNRGNNGWFCACDVPIDDGDSLLNEDGQYKNGRHSFGGMMRKEKPPTAGEVLDTILEIKDTTQGILKEARELVAEQAPQVIKALREKVKEVKHKQRRYSNKGKKKSRKSKKVTRV